MSLSLSIISSHVFVLDKYDQRILKYLALHGPLNLSQISEFTNKYAMNLDRWAVKKRLYGSSRFIGLIPNEYVAVIPKNKKENVYHLTVKGILASTSIIPLRDNYFFNNYVEFIADKIKTPKARKIAGYCVEQFIKLLLSWHYLNGINLTLQKASSFYYMEFFEHIRSIGAIDIVTTESKEHKEFLSLVKKCVASYTFIDLITSGKLRLSSLLSQIDWSDIKVEKTIFINPQYEFGQYLWEWPLFLGTHFSYNGKVKNEISFDMFDSSDVVEDVKKYLKIADLNIDFK